jgi:hypothetical protein
LGLRGGRSLGVLVGRSLKIGYRVEANVSSTDYPQLRCDLGPDSPAESKASARFANHCSRTILPSSKVVTHE